MLRGVAASCAFSLSPILDADPVSLCFDIAAYRIEGNTLLTNNQVQSAVALFRGKTRPASPPSFQSGLPSGSNAECVVQ